MVEREQKTWAKVSSPLRVLGTWFFLGWLSIVLISGFAFPMGHSEWAWWPWNQSWFMFYRASGKHYHIHASGKYADGTPAPVSLDKYFRYQAAHGSNRVNEMSRTPHLLRQVAAFVCRRFNEEAPPERRLSSITITDSFWADSPGRRRLMEEVPADQIEHWNYVNDVSCDVLQVEWTS